MDDDLAERVVKKLGALGASYAEARIEDVSYEYYVMRKGNLDAANESRATGIGMRALVGGALAFASLDRLTPEAADAQAERCVRLAGAAAKRAKRKIRLCSEKAHVATVAVKEKRKLSSVSREEKLALLNEVDKSVPEGVKVPGRNLYMQLTKSEKLFVNSDGARIRTTTPIVYMSATATVNAKGKNAQAMLWMGGTGGWEAMLALDGPGRMERECRILNANLTKGKAPPKGKIDIVVGPEVTGIATHESCGHPYEADRIMGREAAQAGESFVKLDMLGKRIGSKAATVIEDPTLPGSYGHYLYDDEGVKARPRTLMKNGIINEFLHNRETAARAGLRSSNGSARADGFNREPLVRMANTFVKPGDHKFEELIEDVKLGVYVNSFNEWNIDDTRYNQKYVGREAFLIEKGELKGPVKDPRIEVTTPDFWSAVDAVGSDFFLSVGTCGKGEPGQGVPVGMGGPHMRLRGLRLGGA
ncbi:MAG: TldD/PmbA family protein [Methanobacteriota archaeon]